MTTRLAALVRRQLDPPRPRPARRRRRLPLPPSADPRCRLRRAPQGGPRRPARPLRRLARRARRGPGRARRDRRLPPRAGQPATRRSSGSPTPASPTAPPPRLAAAGRRAVDRQDYRTGAALLARAAELVRPHRLDLALELESAWAQRESMRCGGRDGGSGHGTCRGRWRPFRGDARACAGPLCAQLRRRARRDGRGDRALPCCASPRGGAR